MPFAAESHSNANLTAIIQIYQKSIRFVVLLALPLFALTFVAAPAFMVAWVGHGYAISARTFQILLVGQFASVVSMPSYYIFLSTHVRYTAVIAVLNGILDVVMCLGLGYFYGYSGIIVGFTLVMLILSLLSIYVFYKTFHIRPLSLFRYVPLRSVVFSLILAVSLWGLLIQWSRPGFVGLALIGLIFGAAYCAFLWYSHLVSDDEVRGLTEALKVALR
jgi:O-antigen/teichoic acid export membrane protein